MKKIALLLCIMIGIISCSKDQETPDTSPLGKITGSISPIQAAASISLTDQFGQISITHISPIDGSFSFKALREGRYLLSTPPHPIFSSLNQVEVTLNKDQNTHLGTLHLNELSLKMGLLVGKLLPVGFGTSITATHMVSGKQTIFLPDGQTGIFLSNLASGSYTISFQTISAVQPPPSLKINIVGGDRIDLGEQLCKPLYASSIKGKLIPASAVAGINAISTFGGPVITGILDPRTGDFIFPALDPGSYELSISNRIPYQPIAPIKVKLLEKQVLNLGNISLTKDPNISFLTFKVNDKPYLRYQQQCSFTAGVLSFSLSERFTSMIDTKTWLTTTFSLSQANITGVGKYTLLASGSSSTSLEEKRSQGTAQLWNLQPSAAVGHLEITNLDPLTRTIKGTFSATLVNKNDPNLPHKLISAGSFSFNY